MLNSHEPEIWDVGILKVMTSTNDIVYLLSLQTVYKGSQQMTKVAASKGRVKGLIIPKALNGKVSKVIATPKVYKGPTTSLF